MCTKLNYKTNTLENMLWRNKITGQSRIPPTSPQIIFPPSWLPSSLSSPLSELWSVGEYSINYQKLACVCCFGFFLLNSTDDLLVKKKKIRKMCSNYQRKHLFVCLFYDKLITKQCPMLNLVHAYFSFLFATLFRLFCVEFRWVE